MVNRESVQVNLAYDLIYIFLREYGGKAPQFFCWDFSSVWRGGGGAAETFSWLFHIWKKNDGGGERQKSFFWRHFFTTPYGFLNIYSLIFPISIAEKNVTNEGSLWGGHHCNKILISRINYEIILYVWHHTSGRASNLLLLTKFWEIYRMLPFSSSSPES